MTCVMFFAIWYHFYDLKNVKNTHGGVLFLVKLQAKTLLHGCFSHFLNLYKWYQIAQRITYCVGLYTRSLLCTRSRGDYLNFKQRNFKMYIGFINGKVSKNLLMFLDLLISRREIDFKAYIWEVRG